MRTQQKYGVDIAMTRADDLDKKMIVDVAKQVQAGYVPSILDLGCGGGGQTVRLAAVGALVVGVDIDDHTDAFSELRATQGIPEGSLEFKLGDISKLAAVLGDQRFDSVCLQRVLHYVPYATALLLLRDLRKRIQLGGKLYSAVTGLESAIGREYKDADKSVVDRFCRLSATAAETFSITQSLCLYTPEEFIVLLQESGWEIEECWVSAFGNIKVVCR
jgi:SAM-dependent methyltransferase